MERQKLLEGLRARESEFEHELLYVPHALITFAPNELPESVPAKPDGKRTRPSLSAPSWMDYRSLESLEGQHAREDSQKAFQLNAQWAKSGMHDAVLAMGWFYLNGVGVEQDIEQAELWYRKSARQGNPSAMYSLGIMSCDRRDYADALVWFRRATDKGHARSLFWLGKLYWRGHGVPRDRKQAMSLFQKAAVDRVPAARRALRFLLRNPSPW